MVCHPGTRVMFVSPSLAYGFGVAVGVAVGDGVGDAVAVGDAVGVAVGEVGAMRVVAGTWAVVEWVICMKTSALVGVAGGLAECRLVA